MQRQHDMGGMPAGPVEPDSPPTRPWAKLITATVGALREKKLMTVDEMRRALEDLPPEQYDRDYFERWAEALTDLLEEKGLASHDEIETRMNEIRRRLESGT